MLSVAGIDKCYCGCDRASLVQSKDDLLSCRPARHFSCVLQHVSVKADAEAFDSGKMPSFKQPVPCSLACFSPEAIRCICLVQIPCQLSPAQSCLPEPRWMDIRYCRSSHRLPARICIRYEHEESP